MHDSKRHDGPPHLDPGAWPELVDSLEPASILVVITGWMGERLRREFGPEDIWQETLTMAWRDRESHEWRSLRAFRAWLLGIAKNRIRDAAEYLGAKKRGGGIPTRSFSSIDPAQPESPSSYLPPRTTTPSRVASEMERAGLMMQSLGVLPKELETVVRLRLFEELPMREVAERTGVGLTTASERFYRGSKIYQRELAARLGTIGHKDDEPA